MEKQKVDPNAPIHPYKTQPEYDPDDSKGIKVIKHIEHFPGLTKREYFAIKCLQGLVSGKVAFISGEKETIKSAIKLADLLIEELNK